MFIHEIRSQLLEKLITIYDKSEAQQITDWVIEHISGKEKLVQITDAQTPLSKKDIAHIEIITERLLQHEPVQYVLEESWFGGLKFYVNKNVLIPRPETEELVHWIIESVHTKKYNSAPLKILDVGTGSGCIPIYLAKKMKNVQAWSCDSSQAALAVAQKNAATNAVTINFLQLDFLDKTSWEQLPEFDIIVSNPPYVPEKDKTSMDKNVLAYEPKEALFVPDNDALVFYKAIAEFSKKHLPETGKIFLEIHESIGFEVSSLFQNFGFRTILKKDLQMKDRMVCAHF